jgi:hypothetical protein
LPALVLEAYESHDFPSWEEYDKIDALTVSQF